MAVAALAYLNVAAVTAKISAGHAAYSGGLHVQGINKVGSTDCSPVSLGRQLNAGDADLQVSWQLMDPCCVWIKANRPTDPF